MTPSVKGLGVFFPLRSSPASSESVTEPDRHGVSEMDGWIGGTIAFVRGNRQGGEMRKSPGDHWLR